MQETHTHNLVIDELRVPTLWALLGPCPRYSFRTLFGLFWGSGPEGPGRPCVGRGRSQRNASGGRVVLLPGACWTHRAPKWPVWAHLFQTVLHNLGKHAPARCMSYRIAFPLCTPNSHLYQEPPNAPSLHGLFFSYGFQEVKRPLRTKSVKRPIKVGKRPINDGKRPIKAMVLVGISVGCLMGCFPRTPRHGGKRPL